MNGRDFVDSKWCKEAQDPKVQSALHQNFKAWQGRVRNTGILERASQLFHFFLSPKITASQKIIVGGALLYIIAPIDLIPDVIPIAGWLDDLGVAGFALRYIFASMDQLALAEMTDSAAPAVSEAKAVSEAEILDEEIPGTTNKTSPIRLPVEAGNFDAEPDIKINARADSLRQRIGELKDIASILQVQEPSEALSKVENRLIAFSMPTIAVVGRYSTGKSTLINSLLGIKLLPVSPTPTTKAITSIMKGVEPLLYSEQPSGEIIVHQSVEDLRNPADAAICKARSIAVALPDFPFSNLIIVDTPGLEDPDQDISRLTLGILPETDVIVMVLDAGYLQSQVEFDFIASLLKADRERKLFFVLNKIDNVPEGERGEIVKICQSLLIGKGVPSPKVFPLSAKKEDGAFKSFKKALFDFLEHGVHEEALRHSEKEVSVFSATLQNACVAAIANSEQDRKQQQENARAASERMDKIKASYEKRKREFSRKFASYKSRFCLDFNDFMEEMKGKALMRISQAKLDELRHSDVVSVWMKKEIVAYLERELAEMDKSLQADISTIQNGLREELSTIQLPLSVQIKDYSGLSSVFLPVTVVASYFVLGFGLSFLGVLIAGIVGRNYFESTIAKLLDSVGANRVRKELCLEISANIDKAKVTMNEKLGALFCSWENETLASFDESLSVALSQYALVSKESAPALSEVSKCRERLAALVQS